MPKPVVILLEEQEKNLRNALAAQLFQKKITYLRKEKQNSLHDVEIIVDGDDGRISLLAGYAGTDFLENLYKLRSAQFFKMGYSFCATIELCLKL